MVRRNFRTFLPTGRLKDKFSLVLKNQAVTLAMDGGQVHKKLQTFCFICNKKAYFWKCCSVLHNDAETLLALLESAKKYHDDVGAKLVAIVADNHSGIQKVVIPPFSSIIIFVLGSRVILRKVSHDVQSALRRT